MLEKYYAGISKTMINSLETISEQMDHMGERGRNNEAILTQFLERHLPHRYTVSTGKVSAASGKQSGQIDVIIHDRLNTPTLVDGAAWSFAPIEAVYSVISVKTTLNRRGLQDGMQSIQSVRELPRTAAFIRTQEEGLIPLPEETVLRPRGVIFGFRSDWLTADSADNAFRELLENCDDRYRPNAICIVNQCFIVREPYTTKTEVYRRDPLMHFFLFLTRSMARMPKFEVDLSKYFAERYGDDSLSDITMSGSPPGDPYQ